MNTKILTVSFLILGGVFLAGNHTVNAQTQTKNQTIQPKTVVINSGDTLSSIAEANQTTYQRLFNANTQIENPDMIYPDQSLRIPEPSEQLADRPIPAGYVATVTSSYSSTKTYSAPANYVAGDGSAWDQLAQCESGGNWNINTGNGYYGGLQFTAGTWAAVGGSGLPSDASREEQIARAQQLAAGRGYSPWPACSAKLGL